MFEMYKTKVAMPINFLFLIVRNNSFVLISGNIFLFDSRKHVGALVNEKVDRPLFPYQA